MISLKHIAALAAGLAAGLTALAGAAQAQEALNGAGATFPAPIYQRWFQEYGSAHNVQINYQPIGSGGGIKAITGKTVDFGASDAPMNAAELAAAPGILHIPTVAGAVVLTYNVPGIKVGLRLSGPVIADIFLGKITKWNDPAITRLNPGPKFPNIGILPVHRADSSGTTNIFTTYLSEVSGDWNDGPGAGKSVHWPSGLGGVRNNGVAQLVQKTEGGIGYVELNYAYDKLPYAAVRNKSGAWIFPTAGNTSEAVDGVTLPADFRKVAVNTSAPGGYPITGFTYLLVYRNGTKATVKQFLEWALSPEGGQKDAEAMQYAPLPPGVRRRALAAVAGIH